MCGQILLYSFENYRGSVCHCLVPSQPRHVVARALNSSAIYLNWSEPADKNGVLLYYQVWLDLML